VKSNTREFTRIHDKCVQHGTADGLVNYVRGANIAGFIKVADAMLACGID
jgi:glutamate dehydrogenase (NADP+)